MADKPIKVNELIDINGIDEVINRYKKLEQSISANLKKVVAEQSNLNASLKSVQDQIRKNIEETGKLTTGSEQNQKALTKNTEQLNNLSSAYNKNVQQITQLSQKEKELVKQKNDLSTLTTKLTSLDSESAKKTAELKARIQEKTKALKNEALESVGLLTIYQKQSKHLNDLRNRYKDLVLTEKENTKEARNLKKEIDSLDSRLKKTDASVGQFQRNVGNYGKAWSSVGSILRSAGVIGGIAGVVSVFKNASKTIADFQQANANLASVLGKNRKDITALTKDQQRLGASTKFTATEVAGLQTEFAKLGFTEKEILNVTEATLQLAAATNTDLAEAASVAGSTLRAFGLDSTETQRVVDVMAKSFSSSSLDMSKFSTAMGAVAPVAKSAGVSIERTTALIGILTDNGIDASTAGTGLRNVFLDLAAKGLTFEQAMDKINKSSDKNVAALNLFGKRGATIGTVLAASNEKIEELEKVLGKAGGAAEKMANEQLDTLKGEITLMGSAWDGFILGLEDGDGVISKTVRGAIKLVTELLGVLTSLSKTSQELREEVAKAGLKIASTEDVMEFKGHLERVKEFADVNQTAMQVAEKFLSVDKEKAAELERYIGNIDGSNKILEKRNKEEFDRLVMMEKSSFFTTDEIKKQRELVSSLKKTTDENNKRLSSNERRELRAIKNRIAAIEDYAKTADGVSAADTENIKKLTDEQEKLNRKRRKAARDLATFLLNQEIELLKETTNNTERSVNERLAASELIVDKEMQIAAIVKDGKLDTEKELLAEEKKLIDQQNKYAISTAQRAGDKRADALFGGLKSKINADFRQTIDIDLKNRLNALETSKNAELTAIEGRLLDTKEKEQQIFDVEEEYRRKSLEATLKFLKNKADLFAENDEERLQLRKEISGIELELARTNNTEQINLSEELVNKALEFEDVIADMVNNRFERDMSILDRREERLNESFDNEIALAGENEEAKIKIEEEFQKRREELERQRISIERKQANFQKLQGIFSIGVNTAIGIGEQLPGLPYTAPLIALIAALGAAQIAVVAGAPIPAYADGTESAEGGRSLVGEIGEELVYDPKRKKAFLTPDEPTIMDIPKGAKVFTAAVTKKMKHGMKNGNIENNDIIRQLGIKQAKIATDNDIIATALVSRQANTEIDYNRLGRAVAKNLPPSQIIEFQRDGTIKHKTRFSDGSIKENLNKTGQLIQRAHPVFKEMDRLNKEIKSIKKR